MLNADFSFKQGDVGKTITGQFLQRQADGAQIVLLDETALASTETPLNCEHAEGRLIITDYATGDLIFVGAIEFIEGAKAEGKFTYGLSSTDVAIDSGWYKAEFKVLLNNTEIRTFPTDALNPYLLLYVAPGLAPVTLDNFANFGEPEFGEGEFGGQIS